MTLGVPLVEYTWFLDLTCGDRERPCLPCLLSTQHFLLVERITVWGSHIV
jgi:hypothetical protein